MSYEADVMGMGVPGNATQRRSEIHGERTHPACRLLHPAEGMRRVIARPKQTAYFLFPAPRATMHFALGNAIPTAA